MKVVTADEFFLPRISGGSEVFPPSGLNETGNKRTVMTKTFTKDSGKTFAAYQMRGKAVEVGEN